MKNIALNFLGKTIALIALALGLVACAAGPLHENLYQTKIDNNSQLIQVLRDDKLYKRYQKEDVKDCPIAFYINDKKVGNYLVNEQSSYYLEPGSYIFQVENCQGRCSAYDVEYVVNPDSYPASFVLSVDLSGKPFIIRK